MQQYAMVVFSFPYLKKKQKEVCSRHVLTEETRMQTVFNILNNMHGRCLPFTYFGAHSTPITGNADKRLTAARQVTTSPGQR